MAARDLVKNIPRIGEVVGGVVSADGMAMTALSGFHEKFLAGL